MSETILHDSNASRARGVLVESGGPPMLERIPDLPAPLDGFLATGKISREDYEHTFEPLIDAARRDGRRLRLLYQFGPEFQGFTPGGVWEDAKLGLRSIRMFDGCAIVSDVAFIREATKLAGFVMPCPVRVFPSTERGAAVAWLGSLPEVAAVVPRLLADSGVIVVEITQALRAQDFDALADIADAWISAHGELRGLVIHMRTFPGWENFGSLLRHVRFVRDHQRKVRRVAFAADSPLASLGPQLGAHFVEAELKGFGYDDAATAIAWAGGQPARPATAQT